MAVSIKVTNPEKDMGFLVRKFGDFSLVFEMQVFGFARMMSDDYQGGLWEWCESDCGGWYMRPDKPEAEFVVTSPNGAVETVSADAFGIIVCMMTFSHMSCDIYGRLRHEDGKIVDEDKPLHNFMTQLADSFYDLGRYYGNNHPESEEIARILD